MSEPITAIVIDPESRTIVEVELQTEPGNHEYHYGTHVDVETWCAIIGCDMVEMHYLPDDLNMAVIDDKSLLAETPPGRFWQWGENCQPVTSKGVIAGYDFKTDTWSSTTLSLEEARKMVRYTKRNARGMRTEMHGLFIRAEMNAAIAPPGLHVINGKSAILPALPGNLLQG
jgi:hypothetical protein